LGPRNGALEHITVNGRAVDIYLPPSYASDAMRRFPVVYLLAERPADNLKLQEAADRLSSAQGFSEPIVVLPDPSGSLADLAHRVDRLEAGLERVLSELEALPAAQRGRTGRRAVRS
jgi:hypothetical protein